VAEIYTQPNQAATAQRYFADVGAFERALALDSSLTEARAGLQRAKWMQARRRWSRAGVGAAVALGLALMLWLLWKRTAPKTPAATT